MSSEPKFCKDCKYFKRDWLFSGHRCLHPKARFSYAIGDYLVTGKIERNDYFYCHTMRTSVLKCGEEAVLFEPKTKHRYY